MWDSSSGNSPDILFCLYCLIVSSFTSCYLESLMAVWAQYEYMNTRPTINIPYSTTDNLILKYDNSFNAQYVKTGQRPQNFIKNVDPTVRYIKYPRMSLLMQEKNSWTKKRNHPPVYIKADIEDYDLAALGKFDVVYCDPPWEEYERRAKKLGLLQDNPKYYKSMALQQLKKVRVGDISDSPSFIFLWAGTDHLEDARQLLKEWGFKRCEDIVWVKTNQTRKKIPQVSEQSIFARVKQHCLMGYKGDSKKAFDSNFIHPNIDIDVVITEQPEVGSLSKPSEVYDIIERFCLGRKRIELFGTKDNIRNGWLTIGNQIPETKFILSEYNKWFEPVAEIPAHFHGGRSTGTTPGIESVRPKEDSHQSQTQLVSQRSFAEDDGKRSMAKSDNGK